MSAYLKHTPTGEVYVFTDILMKRGDMQPCDAKGNLITQKVEEVVESPKPKARAPRKTKAKAEPKAETPNDEIPDLSGLDLGDFSSGVDDPE